MSTTNHKWNIIVKFKTDIREFFLLYKKEKKLFLRSSTKFKRNFGHYLGVIVFLLAIFLLPISVLDNNQFTKSRVTHLPVAVIKRVHYLRWPFPCEGIPLSVRYRWPRVSLARLLRGYTAIISPVFFFSEGANSRRARVHHLNLFPGRPVKTLRFVSSCRGDIRSMRIPLWILNYTYVETSCELCSWDWIEFVELLKREYRWFFAPIFGMRKSLRQISI